MADGVRIPLSSMERLDKALRDIVVEFEDAGGRTDDLVEAIGRPMGRSKLREQAHAFESRWDDKRETLKGHLVELQKQVEGVRDAWAALDGDLAAQLETK
ncbi:hypothetical protein [Agromyces marinus]|uniref:Flagellar protein FlgN n=1 Tax=Agromyces marinus TaxID=1389020 RepID=A0ABN6YDJ6_9MICO|nr:hypothetical protein [Agromyces marinus]UIP59463.1 hypothetical protein DSM26151_23700 [Agromyces marinus]BDZ55492.1 hypothetical protein GCM10025870_25650 [Agromyces marinus]